MGEQEDKIKALELLIVRELEARQSDRLANHGRPIDEVSERQKRRKISQLKSTTQKVL